MPATEPATDQWDLVITADRGAADSKFAELWRYRDLLWLFVRRDFVAFYKQTILGPVWIFIQPLLTSIVYLVVFHRLAGLPTDEIPPILFYLAGVSCWTFFADCVLKTSETFSANVPLFEKVYFPRLVIPLSAVAASLIRLAIQFCLFFLFWAWYSARGLIQPSWSLAAAPLLIGLMAAMGLGSGLVFAALTSKYRDLKHLLQFGTQLLMFATPVIYPLSLAGAATERFLYLNPLTPVFEAFRAAVLGAGDVSAAALAGATLAAILLIAIGLHLFYRVERTFIDTV